MTRSQHWTIDVPASYGDANPCPGDVLMAPIAVYLCTESHPVESAHHRNRHRLTVRRIGTRSLEDWWPEMPDGARCWPVT